ncbi:MAG: glycosyltransferase family 4 protein [Agarilytica sp.]
MKILHVLLSRLPLPPTKYGGTERVVWSLAQGQILQGHDVRFLWKKASPLPKDTIIYNKKIPLTQQIGDWPDVVHFHWPYEGELHKPFVCTEHGNANHARSYPINTVFLSKKHAENHGAKCYIYNGLDWRSYGEPNLTQPKNYFHFLGKAKTATKNLAGAIDIAKRAKTRLDVLGGSRFNFTRSPIAYWDLSVKFHGMVGGQKKINTIKNSNGLIAPSLWHEPFGLAITESLYLGCPVFATPFGSHPEIIDSDEIGLLSTSYEELAEGIKDVSRFSRMLCHQTAKEKFGMGLMAENYLKTYEKVINNETLNPAIPRADKSYITLLSLEDKSYITLLSLEDKEIDRTTCD